MIIKVGDKPGSTSNFTEISSKEDIKQLDKSKKMFSEKLKLFGDKNQEDRIQLLVGKIIEQGEKLSKKVDIRELKVYKKLVAEFLDEAVDNSHKFSKESFLDKRGRHRVFAVVKNINKELDELTKDILESEKNNIKIIGRLDDIRGMIMDIIM